MPIQSASVFVFVFVFVLVFVLVCTCICVFVRLDVEYAEPCPSHLSAKQATIIMRKNMVIMMIMKDDYDDEVRKQMYLFLSLHWSRLLTFISSPSEISVYSVR